MSVAMNGFKEKLDAMAGRGERVHLWWRDDDATAPTPALDRLIELSVTHRIPCLLAVIPAGATGALSDRLRDVPTVRVAVHGWSHENHAGDGEKKQELGAHRPVADVLAQLDAGRVRLATLFGDRMVPILVPPWNRIAPGVVAELSALGFDALSVFGPETSAPPPRLNTHVDLIDWRGTRGGRADGALIADLTAAMSTGVRDIGLLTHHLVHDTAAWSFMERLFALTTDHPACRWRDAASILRERVQT